MQTLKDVETSINITSFISMYFSTPPSQESVLQSGGRRGRAATRGGIFGGCFWWTAKSNRSFGSIGRTGGDQSRNTTFTDCINAESCSRPKHRWRPAQGWHSRSAQWNIASDQPGRRQNPEEKGKEINVNVLHLFL